MDAETIEKEIKSLKTKIANLREIGKIKIEESQKLHKEAQDDAIDIMKWTSQVEALEKVLNN